MTKTHKKIAIAILIVATLSLAGLVLVMRAQKKPEPSAVGVIPDAAEKPPVTLEPDKPTTPPLVVEDEGPKAGQEYYAHTMKTANAQKELASLVGADNVMAVLQTNRIDAANIKQGAVVIVPTVFDTALRSPFPLEIPMLEDVPKFLAINQRVQAFGAYENGKLVRWGPVNSGKQSTKTPNGLFSTNWKGKEVKSSFDDEWLLKYNFNINNFEGIGFHQYAMPGYPASHSCVRLLTEDAMWLYDWADQWILSPDEQTRLAHGTPVMLFEDYEFGKTAPWKLLPGNPDATDIGEDDMNAVLSGYIDTIQARQAEREALIGTPTNG